jgi:DNA-nicking Smr family endonuclease|tara:strand:+ start:79 stop:531 length:453 start_codon:yes stop_codon:yes gene_type:complete
MGRKSSTSSSLIFEESDQHDSLMEQIFEDIIDVPDKEPALEIPLSKSSPKKKQSSAFNTVSRPDQELDLHGKTREEAIMMVQNFVKTCHDNQFRTGLIITGKGHNSGNQGPVLKKEVKFWLERNGKPYLSDFHEAPPRFGGSGAIWLNFK